MTTASIGLLADTWGTNGHMGGGWWVVMMVGMLLFWCAVIVGIVWLVRGGSFDAGRVERRETSLEVLDRRFAEGGLSADDYQERRAVLAGSAGPHHGGPSGPTQS